MFRLYGGQEAISYQSTKVNTFSIAQRQHHERWRVLVE